MSAASRQTENESLAENETALSRIQVTQPDGTVIDIGDTCYNHVRTPSKLVGPTAWRDNGGLSSTVLHDVPQGTPSDGQTEINDHGDTAQLDFETAKSGSKPPTASEDEISYVGGAPGFGDQAPVDGYPSLDISEPESELDGDLWMSIDAQLIEPPPENGQKYLPLNELRKLMVRPRVRKELQKLGGFDQETICRYANEVCDTTKYGDTQKTTRHKMFAILVHIEHVEALPSLINEGIHDVHLPFTLQKGLSWHLTYTTTDKVTNQKVTAKFEGSTSWTKGTMSSFVEKQWLFMAPFFDMKASKPPFYPLEAKVVLPFLKEEKLDTPVCGGFSTVSKTHIHEAHHNSKHAIFAIKRLISYDKLAFDQEHHAMKKFNRQDHPHLTKLLATYQYQEHWHFIFPWANGNLRQFWEKYPVLQPDHKLVAWIAKQATGIASGLNLIQHPPNDPMLTQDARNSGRHGDLKPENVLWFSDNKKEEEIIGSGVLKIADFGLTRYHRHSSRYAKAKGLNFSLTYKAPEVDVSEEVSQAYDIWTLGCLLLEFVTWYLEGWHQGVDRFSADRAKTNAQEDDIPLDTFYYVTSVDGVKGAVLKPAVKDKLHNHKNCSLYFHNLLTYILHHLLRINPKKREKCADVVKKLEHMAEICTGKPEYAVLGCAKPPNKSDTTETTRTDITVSDYGCFEAEYNTPTTLVGSRNSSPERSGAPHDFVALSELPNSTTDHDDPVLSQTDPKEDLIETPEIVNETVIFNKSQSFDVGDASEQSSEIEYGEEGLFKRRRTQSPGFEGLSPETKRSRLFQDESTLVEGYRVRD
ncbi:kinase domain-containing protein [Colletotrichum caudatum]|nr:kinase domain-containing protein [Colletotrichum caudatum]